MRLSQLVFTVSIFLCASASWSQDPVLGQWNTLDDDTGEAKSLVTLSLSEDGTMVGIITTVFDENAGDGLCKKCEGELKNQPMEGMRFIWGFKKIAEGKWEKGQLLDPETGAIYSGNINITDDPSELEIRGYIGISLFGRSQTWRRAKATNF